MPDTKGTTAAPGPRRPNVARRALALLRRRPVIGGVCLLLATMLTVRLWWGWHLRRRLAAQEAAIRQRGDPVTRADFAAEFVPDAENAWLLIQQAAALNSEKSPAQSTLEYPNYPPYGPAWDKLAAASETDNARVFELARQARAMQRAQVVARRDGPFLKSAFPSGLNEARAVANTLGDSAQHLHLNGDDAGAIERLRDAVRVAEAVQVDDGLICQLIANGLYALASHRAQVIAAGLRPLPPAARDSARALITAFTDDEPTFRMLRRSCAFDRLVRAESYRTLAARTWVIRPLSDVELLDVTAETEIQIAAAAERDLVSADRVLAAITPVADSAPWQRALNLNREEGRFTMRRYSRWFDPGYRLGDASRRLFTQVYRGIAERRVAAVSLAIALYRGDHDGRFPERLEQLVPGYLPAIPADPFRADGRPISYVTLPGALPGGAGRPMLWLDAGLDLPEAVDAEPMYGWQVHRPASGRRWDSKEIRQYRDLARWLPPKRRFDEQALPEAVGDDPEQPDTPRQEPEKHDGAEQ